MTIAASRRTAATSGLSLATPSSVAWFSSTGRSDASGVLATTRISRRLQRMRADRDRQEALPAAVAEMTHGERRCQGS